MASQPHPPAIDPMPPSSATPPLCPTVEMTDLQSLIPDFLNSASFSESDSPSAPPEPIGETLIEIPGAILHLIDKKCSVELATGDLRIVCLRQGDNTVAALASVDDSVQWPLGKDIAAVKLDSSHYFFSFQVPRDSEDDDEDRSRKKKDRKKSYSKRDKDDEHDVLNYGLTIASKGQEKLLKELDKILGTWSHFSEQKVETKATKAMAGSVAEIAARELEVEEKKEEVVGQCAAYWTTLAPNVEDYSGLAAKLIAIGSGQLVKGILWCGDVTIERLNWGHEVLKQRMGPGENKEIDPVTMKRIKRVKKVTKMTEKVATGVLSGMLKVSGFFTSCVSNSSVGKKFFNTLPGEVVLASLDGFSKLCDAVEVAGKNVMTTSSTVTTDLVSCKYGEEAGKAALEACDATGHAMGTAWAVFQIRKGFAVNPKSILDSAKLKAKATKTEDEMPDKGAKKKAKTKAKFGWLFWKKKCT